jgi:hypothetical protein
MVNFFDSIPPGLLRLVDNRIVVGDSTFGTQPLTILVLHPKQTFPEHKERIRAMLDCINQARADQECKTPAGQVVTAS